MLHCIDNVPAYSSLSHLRSLIQENPKKALLQFPILSKQTFKNSINSYLNINVNKNKLILNRTGGSTGEPIKFYFDRKTAEIYEAA